jgi:glycine dehydrogenase subunit 1
MHKYIPNTTKQVQDMLEDMGHTSIQELFQEIPENAKLNRDYDLEQALPELEVMKRLQTLANMNRGADQQVSFLGAGSYDHYIPSIVKHITGRSEFYTAYTPYQPEVAQGTLQYIFEYQSMMTELTGMDVSNASMYDGSTATAEAISMATSKTRRQKVLVADTIHPNTLAVLQTTAHFRQVEIVLINNLNGLLDLEDLKSKLDKEVACVVVSNPNFYGQIEDLEAMSGLIHQNKSLLIAEVNPMSLPLLKTPRESGVDICVGDAQVFGIPQNFGGPYLGFLTTTTELMRKMPGRICGQTKDVDGKRAFVLTLQAREQHIRREKANSNICSNQSLNVLAASVYLSTMGKQGIKEVAEQNIQKAHYAFQQITQLEAFEPVFEGPFFNEFVVKSSIPYETVQAALAEHQMIAGLDLGMFDDKLSNHILFCVTEKRSKQEIDQLVSVLGGIK